MEIMELGGKQCEGIYRDIRVPTPLPRRRTAIRTLRVKSYHPEAMPQAGRGRRRASGRMAVGITR